MKYKNAASLILIGLLSSWQALAAQEQDVQVTLQKLQDLLQQQQQELESQRKELAEQRVLILQLQGGQGATQHDFPAVAVEEATPDASVAAPPTGPDTPAADADQSGQQQAVMAMAEKQATAAVSEEETNQQAAPDLQAELDDPANTIYDPNFPGAWYLPGTTAAMKLGGYVNLSIVNSFDPLLIPDRFIVGSIPPTGQTSPDAVKGVQVSAAQTRLNLEYREQTEQGEVRAFVEGDFQGDNDTYKLRHAFGQFRSVLAGKTWSTFMDIDSRPEEVDAEGINGQVLLRHSQLRWTPQFGQKFKLKLALEDPTTDVVNGSDLSKGSGDLVASLDHMPLGYLGHWNYRVGLILRDLRATPGDREMGPDLIDVTEESRTGWGITTSGRQPVSRGSGSDYILWQLVYGKGIGHYINDLSSIGGGDGVFDAEDKLHALPVFAGYVSYQHRWPMDWRWVKSWPGILRSNLTLSWVDISNFEFQDGSDYNTTLRASLNLIYSPAHNMTVGVEFLWGERKNKDGSKGTATQLQASARYSF